LRKHGAGTGRRTLSASRLSATRLLRGGFRAIRRERPCSAANVSIHHAVVSTRQFRRRPIEPVAAMALRICGSVASVKLSRPRAIGGAQRFLSVHIAQHPLNIQAVSHAAIRSASRDAKRSGRGGQRPQPTKLLGYRGANPVTGANWMGSAALRAGEDVCGIVLRIDLTGGLCSCYVLIIAEWRRADERRRMAVTPRKRGIEG
jgi:hypothetical protein